MEWCDWRKESLELARELDRPIYLFVGQVTDSRTQRAADLLFKDPFIADLLREKMIPIAVDWDERPDLREVYRHYLTAAIGQSAPPLSIWLNTSLLPILGKGIFFAGNQSVKSAFLDTLESVLRGWREDRELVDADASRVMRNLSASLQSSPVGTAQSDLVEPAEDAFDRAYTYFLRTLTNNWVGLAERQNLCRRSPWASFFVA